VECAILVFHAQQTRREEILESVYAMLALLTTAILALNVLQVPYGAPKPTNASTSVAKTQHSLSLQANVFATLDLVYLEASAKLALATTSSPMDTVLHAQLTQPITQPTKIVSA
jgi:hypothetical protein